MRAYQNYGYYQDNFSSSYNNNNAWYDYNYEYNCEPHQYNNQWNNFNYSDDQPSYDGYAGGDYCENNAFTPSSFYNKPSKTRSSMLSSKESGRVFYPSKARHSRHNSQETYDNNQNKLNFSPLNKSNQSTCDSSSGENDSAQKVSFQY